MRKHFMSEMRLEKYFKVGMRSERMERNVI